MKHKYIMLLLIVGVLVVLGIYFVFLNQVEQPQDSLDVNISFEASAELRKTDSWRFHMKLMVKNDLNNTIGISWFWLNATRIEYVSGNVEDLGVSTNSTEQFSLKAQESKTLQIILTEFGFQSEPEKIIGEVKIKVAEVDEPIQFSFLLSIEEGNLRKI